MIAKIRVSGRVQGVGFRYIVQQKALALDLKGWVRNNDDGTVSIEIEGTKDQIDAFMENLGRGLHRFIRIDDMDVEYEEGTKGYKNFRVRY